MTRRRGSMISRITRYRRKGNAPSTHHTDWVWALYPHPPISVRQRPPTVKRIRLDPRHLPSATTSRTLNGDTSPVTSEASLGYSTAEHDESHLAIPNTSLPTYREASSGETENVFRSALAIRYRLWGTKMTSPVSRQPVYLAINPPFPLGGSHSDVFSSRGEPILTLSHPGETRGDTTV